MIILSAVIHRDELYYPKDEEMKALFPSGKVTAHMHVDAIPVVYDAKKGCKKISISELWQGKKSYRKFQDYMYKAVGKKYSFERGELHDSNESIEHKSVVEYKVQEALKTLQKQEDELLKKEQELSLRAKEIEPTDDITWRNVKKVIKEQKGINIALRDARNQASSLQNEIDELEKSISDKNNSIETQKCIIKTKVQENENLKKALVFEQEQTNNLLNIPIQDSKLRSLAINEVKQKAKKYERLQRILNNFLPVLKKVCPSFIRELTDYEIIEPDNTSHIHNLNIYKSR